MLYTNPLEDFQGFSDKLPVFFKSYLYDLDSSYYLQALDEKLRNVHKCIITMQSYIYNYAKRIISTLC